MSKYTLQVRPDEGGSGWWVGQMKELPEVITQGRTIEQTLERSKEALACVVGDRAAGRAEIALDVRLPAAVSRRLERVASARKAVLRSEEAARSATKEAAEALTERGLSLRDVGTLLGMTRQRVHQVLSES